MTDIYPEDYQANDFVQTKNKRGFEHPINEIGQAFIDYAATVSGPVIDMGAAYGRATFAALEAGATVIACDIEPQHIAALKQNVPAQCASRLTTKQGQFPQDFDFEEGTIDAIYTSHLLNFLSPDDLDMAVDKVTKWLKPGGKWFICSYTPFLKLLTRFAPVFEQRKLDGVRWPGYMEKVRNYTDDPVFLENLIESLYMVDTDSLQKVLTQNGYQIERANYISAQDAKIPEMMWLDGREWCAVIAQKI